MTPFDEEYILMTVKQLEKDVAEVKGRLADNDRPDSIEFGTPKGGKFKCYGNAKSPEEFKGLIDNMTALLNHASGVE